MAKAPPSVVRAVLYTFAPDEIRPVLERFRIQELPAQRDVVPDCVITYGGDGTFLNAERDWPGVPKVVLRRSRVCSACRKRVPVEVLRDLAHASWKIIEYPKISFTLGLTETVATNDIILRNWNPNQALRFSLEDARGGKVPNGEIIGDGLVFATPAAESAYYQSITREAFRGAFGLAFNNPTVALRPVAFSEEFSLTVRILRENAILCIDNWPSFWFLRAGETFTICSSPLVTRVYDLRGYYCRSCRPNLSF